MADAPPPPGGSVAPIGSGVTDAATGWDRSVPPLPAPLLERYLAVVGLGRPLQPDLASLAALQTAHLQAIPFENLDAMLGRPVSLDLEVLAAKLLAGDRGGYCFEHNLLFASVLTALGYTVDLLGGRVLIGATAARPRTHLALRVWLDGEPVLSDVGFGRTALRGPLRIQLGEEQQLGPDRFRLVDAGGELLLQLTLPDGTWESQYLLDPRPEYVVDCEMSNHWVATHPDSTMKQRVMVLLPTPTGKRSIGGARFVIDEAERQVDRTITPGELAGVLRTEFGIDLPGPVPCLDS